MFLNKFASRSFPYFNSNLFYFENSLVLALNSFRMFSFIVSQDTSKEKEKKRNEQKLNF